MSSQARQFSKFMVIFASGTLFSRVLGMIRDMVLAPLVPALDAFLVAFRLPNMLRDMVGEGALNAAFVPVLSQTLEKDGEEEFRKLTRNAMAAMAGILGALTLLGMIFAPIILDGLNALRAITGAPPRAVADVELVSRLSRWTFPYLFFIGMTVFAMAALFTLRHYATPGWSPALLNLALIGACVAWHYGWLHVFPNAVYALVAAVWVGGLAQLLVMYQALYRRSGIWWPDFHITHPGVRQMILLMLPVIAGQAAGEINKLVDMLFAYQLERGTVTVLYLANRLVQLPLSIFGAATAAAILPAIAASAARKADEEIRQSLLLGLRQCYFFILPAALGLVALGRPIVWLLFERGQFTARDTAHTAQALLVFSGGLIAFSFVKILVTGFYGIKDTRTPVIIASASMVLNIALNCLLVRPLGFLGLALATSLSFSVNAITLYIMLWRRFGPLWTDGFITAFIRITAAGSIAAAIAHGAYIVIRFRLLADSDTVPARLICVAAPCLLAVITYLLLSHILQIKEMNHTLDIFRRKR